ncbi:hypothetical protein IWQ60_011575 [Tieghemiomyces parasiticus]|uniref:Uncharacterized protein n=1 Tax=Tieghemiomyces parasiticus TaxID=78921 RepID=A0A9W8DLE5_9FUNG|nr:hypothetical protein IWQ60_011575 [Tieghemiomyces parasiticus]
MKLAVPLLIAAAAVSVVHGNRWSRHRQDDLDTTIDADKCIEIFIQNDVDVCQVISDAGNPSDDSDSASGHASMSGRRISSHDLLQVGRKGKARLLAKAQQLRLGTGKSLCESSLRYLQEKYEESLNPKSDRSSDSTVFGGIDLGSQRRVGLVRMKEHGILPFDVREDDRACYTNSRSQFKHVLPREEFLKAPYFDLKMSDPRDTLALGYLKHCYPTVFPCARSVFGLGPLSKTHDKCEKFPAIRPAEE